MIEIDAKDIDSKTIVRALQYSSIEHNLPLFKESLGDDYDNGMTRVYGKLWDNYKNEVLETT
jgi:hypothetical protein